jgi:hypothetical protein
VEDSSPPQQPRIFNRDPVRRNLVLGNRAYRPIIEIPAHEAACRRSNDHHLAIRGQQGAPKGYRMADPVEHAPIRPGEQHDLIGAVYHWPQAAIGVPRTATGRTNPNSSDMERPREEWRLRDRPGRRSRQCPWPRRHRHGNATAGDASGTAPLLNRHWHTPASSQSLGA